MFKVTVDMVRRGTALNDEEKNELGKSIFEVLMALDTNQNKKKLEKDLSIKGLGFEKTEETYEFLAVYGAMLMYVIKKICTPAAWKILSQDIVNTVSE